MYPSHDGWAQVGENRRSIILNDYHSDYSRDENKKALLKFPLFPRLPTEISLTIWKYVLQRHRLISITVIDKDRDGPPPWTRNRSFYVTKNGMGNIISGKNYRLSITTNHRLSPLLRVSHQSRQAALQFYRVHFPDDPDTHGERPPLYLNPELDFLHVKTKGFPEILADFVHDAKAYDPLGIGLLNLGIGVGNAQNLELPMDPSSLTPPAISAFTATLTNLQRVFFHRVVYTDARQMFDSMDMAAVRYVRSFPINSQTEAFDLVETDPRRIDADLDKVSIGRDPRAMLCLWRDMERNFEIRRSGKPVKFQYLITAPTWGQEEGMEISTRADAGRLLRIEKELWLSGWDEDGLFTRWGYINPDTPEKIKMAPIPAVGFWLFPVDAFGDVPEGDFADIRWSMIEPVNLTQHRPQLGVFRLP